MGAGPLARGAVGALRVRLLLDEHYPPDIADLLRQRGFDVVAVKREPRLEGSSDADLLRTAIADRRALSTESYADFAALAHAYALAGEHHLGIVFTSARALPRRRDMIGVYVERLAALLAAHPSATALADVVRWLD